MLSKLSVGAYTSLDWPSHTPNYLYSSCTDTNVVIWDINKETNIHSVRGDKSSELVDISCSSEPDKFAVCSIAGNINIGDVRDLKSLTNVFQTKDKTSLLSAKWN